MLETLAKVAAIAVFLIVFAFIGVVLWQSLFSSKEHNYYGSSAQKQNTEKYGANEDSDETRAIAVSKQSTDDRLATYTLWLAAFTGLLVLVSAFQISFLISADNTATQAARAAEVSAKIAEQTLRISQGPNVGVYRWESKNIEENKSPLVTAAIGNNGHSIAIVLDDWSKITVDSSLPATPVYGSHPTNIPLPPGGGTYLELDGRNASTPIVLTQAHIKELMSGQKKFFAWGRITYRDIFDDIWDYGFIVQFAPITLDDGRIIWRDISPGIPNYVFLSKRQRRSGADDK